MVLFISSRISISLEWIFNTVQRAGYFIILVRVTCNFGEDCGNSQYYTCIYIEDSFLIHTAAAAAAAKSLQSCPTLCDLIDGSPPGSSIHGVFQARVLEGVPLPSPMDGPRECHNEWSKSYREGEISYDIPCNWNLKKKRMIQMSLQNRLTDS